MLKQLMKYLHLRHSITIVNWRRKTSYKCSLEVAICSDKFFEHVLLSILESFEECGISYELNNSNTDLLRSRRYSKNAKNMPYCTE